MTTMLYVMRVAMNGNAQDVSDMVTALTGDHKTTTKTANDLLEDMAKWQKQKAR